MALLSNGAFTTIEDCKATGDPELAPLLEFEAAN
jgi:hypothetical protein